MTHELKDLKKKYDLIEEENNKNKKNFSKEINDLHQHYEQRVNYYLFNTQKTGVILTLCFEPNIF